MASVLLTTRTTLFKDSCSGTHLYILPLWYRGIFQNQIRRAKSLCFWIRLRDSTRCICSYEEGSFQRLFLHLMWSMIANTSCPYLMWPMIALHPYCTFQDDLSCSCPSTWCLLMSLSTQIPILHPFFYSPFSRAHFHCLSFLNPFIYIHSNSYSPST